jgi:hypothetical protein
MFYPLFTEGTEPWHEISIRMPRWAPMQTYRDNYPTA